MRIAITGSRGFLGGSFGRFAAGAGHAILGIGRPAQAEPDWPGEYSQADAGSSDLAPILRSWRPDALLLAAGSASATGSVANPIDDFRANLLPLANTIDGVRRAGIAPVLLFPSSAAVYGRPAALPVGESAPVAPISPFGFHKAACELLIREAVESLGLRAVIARIFSLYGPRQRRKLIWETHLQLAGDSAVLEVHGTGSETRDFLHVDDLSAALLLLAGHPRHGLLTVNVGTGTETSVSQLIEEMKRLTDTTRILMCRGLTLPGDPPHLEADVAHLRELAPGWEHRPLRDGLEETMAAWSQA